MNLEFSMQNVLRFSTKQIKTMSFRTCEGAVLGKQVRNLLLRAL
jgi:hypothetical protein